MILSRYTPRSCLPSWRKSAGNCDDGKTRIVREYMATATLDPPTRSTPPCEAESDRTKRCRRCHRVLPIEQFRFHYRSRGIRHRECNRCAREVACESRQRQRNADVYRFLTETRRAQTAQVLGAMVEEIIARYHGVERFARRFHESMEAAKVSRRTATVLRGFLLLVRMMAAHEELSPKIDELTDAELAARKEQSLMQLIREQPVLAVRACRQLGWQLTPAAEIDAEVREG